MSRVAMVCGIIPAYAGSTAHREGGGPGRGDHPRIRGEHCRLSLVSSTVAGSSPHTRGARRRSTRGFSGPGIIPAYAGSTGGVSPHLRRQGDHPRIRGEHSGAIVHCVAGAGSSPHTRGAPGQRRPHVLPARIIPAYAGSTKGRGSGRICAGDHPRIRGEHEGAGERIPERCGSSPHTRGALDGRAPAGHDHRIIPAYAGSTPPLPTAPSSIPDHPRIRGEHCGGGLGVGSGGGSSPHTRGALPWTFKQG